ncbi:MAG: AI-2E family transporter [Nitrospirota bacterium]
MATDRFSFLTLLALVLGLGYLTYEMLKPFFATIAWAVVLSIVFYPVYLYVLRYIKWKSLASLAVLFIILFIILGPFSYISYLLVGEVQDLSSRISTGTMGSTDTIVKHPAVRYIMDRISTMFNVSLTEEDVRATINANLAAVGKRFLDIIPGGLGSIANLLLNFIFMSFAIFFIIRDGAGYLQKGRDYMPFSEEQKRKLATQIKDIVVSTIYGGVIVAITQGIIAGIAYAALGIRSPVLWGFTTAIASFIPLVGTTAVWGVMVVYFLIQGAIWKAIAMLIIGAFVIGMIDNVLRPILVGARTRMPVLAIFFAALGGIQLFGLIGLIMGPLVLALFVSVIGIFRNLEGGFHAE